LPEWGNVCKFIKPTKKTWEAPGGVPTSRRAFYVGSVGLLYKIISLINLSSGKSKILKIYLE